MRVRKSPHPETNVAAYQDYIQRRERRLRALFWMISVLLHLLLLLLLGYVTFRLVQKEKSPRRFDVFLAPVQQPEPAAAPEPKPPGPARGKPDRNEQPPAPERDRKLTVPNLPDELGTATVQGKEQDRQGAKPSGRGLYGNRRGAARRAAVRKFGGDRNTENALRNALHWLARHQEEDGRWMPDPGPFGDERRSSASPGLTGLACLAFMAGGHTREDGLYARNVHRGLRYLLAQQMGDGAFRLDSVGDPKYTMYNHALGTLAVAEASNLSEDQALRESLKSAVRFIAESQQSSGGWDYLSEQSPRSDTSVTCWVVMALVAAHEAGVRVPDATWVRAVMFLEHMSEKNGVAYERMAGRITQEGRGRLSLLAAVLFCKRILGWHTSSDFVRAGAAELRRQPPAGRHLSRRGPASIRHFPYAYWYYGTLAMFQMGGRDWQGWNARMKVTLPALQHRQGDRAGSWDPVGSDAEVGGRTYCTALSALCLGVYTRYLPINETRTRLGLSAVMAGLRSADGVVREEVVDLLRAFGPDALPALGDVVAEVKNREISERAVNHILAHAEKPRQEILRIARRGKGDPPPGLVTALMTLGESGAEALVPLWPRLPERGPLKVSATRFLADYRRRQEVAELLDSALDSRNEFVRLEAIEALLPDGHAGARKAAEALLQSQNTFIRMQAARAIPTEHRTWTVRVLLEALEDESLAVRRTGYEKLVKLLGPFTYNPAGLASQRKQWVRQLRQRVEAADAQTPKEATDQP